MSLPDWQRFGWLTTHQTSASEIRDLLGVLDRDLQDSAVKDISADAQLAMAYNAALKAGTIALAAAGYRASRDQHHYRVIQSLGLTIGTAGRGQDRGGLRASPHFYNTPEEVDRLVSAVGRYLKTGL